MLNSLSPQYISLQGHAVIAYKITTTANQQILCISDPNYPKSQPPRYIFYEQNKFMPYVSGNKTYTKFIYVLNKSIIPDNFIKWRWTQMEAGVIGNLSPNKFPDYSFFTMNKLAEIDKFKDYYITDQKSFTIYYESDALLGCVLYSAKNKKWLGKSSTLYQGENEFGVFLEGFLEIGGAAYYVDFKWITVTCTTETNDIIGNWYLTKEEEYEFENQGSDYIYYEIDAQYTENNSVEFIEFTQDSFYYEIYNPDQMKFKGTYQYDGSSISLYMNNSLIKEANYLDNSNDFLNCDGYIIQKFDFPSVNGIIVNGEVYPGSDVTDVEVKTYWRCKDNKP